MTQVSDPIVPDYDKSEKNIALGRVKTALAISKYESSYSL